MKTSKTTKIVMLLIFVIIMISISICAFAEEAQDITQECTFEPCYSHKKTSSMVDGKYTTYWNCIEDKEPYLIVNAPSGIPCYGVYICFAEMPESWSLQIISGGKWMDVATPTDGFYNVYIPLSGVDKFRIQANAKENGGKQLISINEIYMFSQGEVPDWVQQWQPTTEDADILFLVAHPDDELLFMGGAIPTYAVEQQRNVVVAYMTYSNTTRRSELLNGLWSMGVRNYPVIGEFWDSYTSSLEEAKTKVNYNEALEFVVDLYRKYKPEVVVTHDFNGEYGHGMHQMTAQVAYDAIEQAANEDLFLDSVRDYGIFQVKKFYSHLYEENQIVFNWDEPLESMDGKTSLQLATEAYAYHVTQQSTNATMEDYGTKYDNRVFGLVFSTVGDDENHDDFLENILAPVGYVTPVPTAEPTPAPTPIPEYEAFMPELNDDGFLDEGEYVYNSENDEGIWIYVSQTLKVVILRKYDSEAPLRWYEAEIWSDVSEGEVFNTIYYDDEKKEREMVDPSEIAYEHNVVFAVNTDYYTYRMNTSAKEGIVIRDGEIVIDEPYTDYTKAFPNLDTLALYADGNMTVHTSGELSAQEYLDDGATDVLSFGPYLLRDGVLNTEAYIVSTTNNPRCAIGMIEPGHYAAIIAEGRMNDTQGITVAYLGKLMRAMGCETALNLDGGQTAVMLFMGQQLNKIGVYDGKTNARRQCEILGIGTSELVEK